MRKVCINAALVAFVLSLASVTYGATVSGTVKGPNGKPFKGAFVEAQDMDSRIATNVLSDKDGHYRIEDLPEGQYQLLARAAGYRDADGRIWWGSQTNNRFGYFYLAGSAASQRAALESQKIAK